MDTKTSASTAPDTVIHIQNQDHSAIANADSPFPSINRDVTSPTGPAVSSTPSEKQSETSTGLEWPTSLNLVTARKEKHQLCLDLLKAAAEGDWSRAKSLFDKYPTATLLKEAITERRDTVLHVAAGAKQTVFVQDMLNFMKEKHCLTTLRLQNIKQNTAFCLAAMAGSIPITEAMLKEDPSLLKTRGVENVTPLYLATLFGQKDMSLYLYEEMNTHFRKELTVKDRKSIFFVSIDTTLYDLALKLLQDDEKNELAVADYKIDDDETTQTPLHRLARTPLHLLDQTSKGDKTALLDQALMLIEGLWEKILQKEGAKVWDYFVKHGDLLFDAAHLGNFKFLEKLIHLYPDLVHQKDANCQTIFHIAIMHRHDDIFNLIDKIGFNKQLIAGYKDKEGNSLLHLAAKYPDPSPVSKVPGAALEMQRELRFFKDVESLVMPSIRLSKNKKGQTPQQLFTITHANLLEKGEKWMRDTASQCILVGTIIATVVFSAAFSVPGGNDDKEGIPIHRRNIVFRIFAIADAIALSSSSSILMFLSILTSRYAENDFYRSLPLKLVGELLGLSISIASMMLTFISCFFMAYNHHRSNVIPIFGTIYVFLPVFVFVLSQYSLLRDILCSSFRFRFSSSQ